MMSSISYTQSQMENPSILLSCTWQGSNQAPDRKSWIAKIHFLFKGSTTAVKWDIPHPTSSAKEYRLSFISSNQVAKNSLTNVLSVPIPHMRSLIIQVVIFEELKGCLARGDRHGYKTPPTYLQSEEEIDLQAPKDEELEGGRTYRLVLLCTDFKVKAQLVKEDFDLS